jgi:hypothetical protein
MEDAGDLKSPAHKGMRVQIPPPANKLRKAWNSSGIAVQPLCNLALLTEHAVYRRSAAAQARASGMRGGVSWR